MSRGARSKADGIRVSFRVYPRMHGELYGELKDWAPAERGPRLLFLAQLGLLARNSIAGRTASSPPQVAPDSADVHSQVGDDLRSAIVDLDLSSFSLG